MANGNPVSFAGGFARQFANLRGQTLQRESAAEQTALGRQQVQQKAMEARQSTAMETAKRARQNIAQIVEVLRAAPQAQQSGALRELLNGQTQILQQALQQAGADPSMAQQELQLAQGISQMPVPTAPAEPFTLSPGETRFTGAGEQVAAVPPEEELTTLQRNVEAAFPGQPEEQRRLIEDVLRKPAATQQMTVEAPKLETEAQRALGKAIGEEAASVVAQGQKAQIAMNRLQTMQKLLEQYIASGGKFGALAEERITLGNLMQTIGVSPTALGLPEDTGAGEALLAASRELAMGRIGGEGGIPANTFSEADRNYVNSTVPQIEDTELGFRTKLQIAARQTERMIEASAFVQEKVAEGMSPPEILRAVRSEFQSQPLFTDDEKQQINALTAKSPSPTVGADGQPLDIANMEMNELLALDETTLTAEQVRIWIDRFNALKGQQGAP